MNPLSELSLLYVEDDPLVRKELAVFLSIQVKELHVASNGEEGWESFLNHRPDFVLTDIQMPKMNGLELSKLIKKNSPKTPILLITAYNESSYMVEAISLKIDGYITKPLQFNAFQEDLHRVAKSILQEKAILRQENLLKEYHNVIINSAYVTKMDKDGRIVYANTEFCDLIGYSQHELLGRYQKDLEYVQDGKLLCEMIYKELLLHKIWRGMVKVQKKDGNVLYFETTILPIFNEHGEILEIVAYRQNITELELHKQNLEIKVKEEVEKRIEREGLLIKQSKLAEVGEMLEVITHQWKQPLNNLNMVLYNFNKGFKDKTTQDDTMKYGSENIKFLSETIDDFKSFFKPETQKRTFNIKQTIFQVERILQHQIRMFNIHYENRIDDTLSAYGFPNEFKQVFLSLIINAKDAISENGRKRTGGKILLESQNLLEQNIITVSDSGGGIPLDIMQNIFNPHYTTKGEAGSGIGLYISKTIIEEHMMGTLDVKNIANGTQFVITLPLCENNRLEKLELS